MMALNTRFAEMKTIITDNSALPYGEVMREITRIAQKGFVTTALSGPSYQSRTIYKECVISCTRNRESFTFRVERL